MPEKTTVLRNIQGGGKAFWCPGCDRAHVVKTGPNGPSWDYNGDPIRPTFNPSILVTLEYPTEKHVCHSFVRDGQIQFLGDCTHALAGQTVPVPAWPHAPGSYGGIDE